MEMIEKTSIVHAIVLIAIAGFTLAYNRAMARKNTTCESIISITLC